MEAPIGPIENAADEISMKGPIGPIENAADEISMEAPICPIENPADEISMEAPICPIENTAGEISMKDPVCSIENTVDEISMEASISSIENTADEISMKGPIENTADEIRMEAPICLIENTADNKLVVNPEAINILSKFNQPVVVVAIVGMYRTGKSYLLNKLAGSPNGFGVGSTVRAQTKGIWMWCVPHPIKANHTLVLLDTEGLGDIEKGDGKNDNRIFALGVLLSSALVYNSKGAINQDAMNNIKIVGEISELIKIKSEDNDDEEEEFSSHFPLFIWAVRDFHLELILDGQTISEDEYLENALKLRNPERTTKDQDYNRMRRRIRAYFGTRKCFTFGMPATDDEVLGNLEKAPESELNEKFMAQCQTFCDYIFQNVQAKRVKDIMTVTGHRLGELAKMYTDALTNSKYACMEEAVVSLAEKENQAAVEETIELYVEKMKTIQLPTETLDGFLEQNRRYEEEARQMFLKRSFKDENQVFLQEFMKKLLNEKNGFISMNEEKSLEICNTIIKKLSLNFENALAEGEYNEQGGHAKFKQDLKAIEEEYNLEKGKGVKAEEALQEYIKSKQNAEISIIQQDNALTMKEKEVAEENNRKRISEIEQNFKRLLEEQSNQRLAENRSMLQNTVSEMKKNMEEERRVMNENMERTIREKFKEQELYQKQEFQQQANKLQAQIEKLQKEKMETKRKLQEFQEQANKSQVQIETLQIEKKETKRKLQEFQEQVNKLQAHVDTLQKEKKETKRKLQEFQEQANKSQTEVETLLREKKEIKRRLQEFQEQANKSQAQVETLLREKKETKKKQQESQEQANKSQAQVERLQREKEEEKRKQREIEEEAKRKQRAIEEEAKRKQREIEEEAKRIQQESQEQANKAQAQVEALQNEKAEAKRKQREIEEEAKRKQRVIEEEAKRKQLEIEMKAYQDLKLRDEKIGYLQGRNTELENKNCTIS